jgi:hypothetical protein
LVTSDQDQVNVIGDGLRVPLLRDVRFSLLELYGVQIPWVAQRPHLIVIYLMHLMVHVGGLARCEEGVMVLLLVDLLQGEALRKVKDQHEPLLGKVLEREVLGGGLREQLRLLEDVMVEELRPLRVLLPEEQLRVRHAFGLTFAVYAQPSPGHLFCLDNGLST